MGVSFNKRVNAWAAYVGHKASREHLGYYATKELALEASNSGRPTENRMGRKGSSLGSSGLEGQKASRLQLPTTRFDDPEYTI